MKIILIKTSARTQLPQPPTLSEAGEPASTSGHQTRRQLGDSRAVKTTPVNASLVRSVAIGTHNHKRHQIRVKRWEAWSLDSRTPCRTF